MCLTIGIAMGSWWAYYELGWGGWWFWDPVENASFMPWLAGTALLHSALVMEKRDALKVWTVLLAILTFSLSLMGTFLVRSGVLTSVHAFAVDPQRGIFILAIMTLFTGGGLTLFALRARDLRQGGIFAPISREGALVLNNILLTTACATVFVGTLYPLLLESLTGDKISVGPPYFDMTFGPLMVPLLLALPFGPFLAWKRGDVLGAAQRLMFAAMRGRRRHGRWRLAVFHRGPWLAPFGIALGVWVMAGAVSELAWRVARRAACRWAKPGGGFATCRARPSARRWRTSASACMVVGIIATSAYREERIVVMKPGEQLALSPATSSPSRASRRATGPNYREEIARVRRDARRRARCAPRAVAAHLRHAARSRPPRPAFTSPGAAIFTWCWATSRTPAAMRCAPTSIRWCASSGSARVVMFLAGAVSLSDRRLRVGAPGRARRIAAAPAE